MATPPPRAVQRPPPAPSPQATTGKSGAEETRPTTPPAPFKADDLETELITLFCEGEPGELEILLDEDVDVSILEEQMQTPGSGRELARLPYGGAKKFLPTRSSTEREDKGPPGPAREASAPRAPTPTEREAARLHEAERQAQEKTRQQQEARAERARAREELHKQEARRPPPPPRGSGRDPQPPPRPSRIPEEADEGDSAARRQGDEEEQQD